MSSLRDRLQRLRGAAPSEAGTMESGAPEAGTHPQEEQAGTSAGAASKEPDPRWRDLGVVEMASGEGDFLLRTVKYPVSYRHGSHRLAELAEAAQGLAAFQAVQPNKAGKPAGNRRQPQAASAPAAGPATVAPGVSGIAPDVSGIAPEKLLFLDLETTGLGVGAGNVPFMIGLAYFELTEDGEGYGDIVVEQMLIRHPAEERAMLVYLQSKLPAYSHLITYNGRTFDWPVLLNRFILNGFRQFRWEPVHIDLLHPSRSVWRNTLASCKLSYVEEERLGIVRVDDVPGSLAPSIYFQFLADGDPAPLEGVYRHNETDMLSLVCLAVRFGHLLAGRLEQAFPYTVEAEELLRSGLWLERMGAGSIAEELFARMLEDHRAPVSCIVRLAERDKKCGNWTRAVLLWQKAVTVAQDTAWPDWTPHIELSMYYEHKQKRFHEALGYAEAALELAARRSAGARLDAKRRAELDGIRKRIDRLRSKLGRLSG